MGQTGRKDFIIGCNYWASHAGVHMWSDWDINVVQEDFQRLAELGQDMVRVFPLWSDFQPLTMLYGPSGNSMEIRHGEVPYDDTPEGLAGMNPCMIDRFQQMLDIGKPFDRMDERAPVHPPRFAGKKFAGRSHGHEMGNTFCKIHGSPF